MANKDRKKILAVDDDPFQLSYLEIILNEEHDIIVACSGEEALGYLNNGLIPDIVLLDILMPNMNGYEVYEKIRAIQPMQDIPIVFLTSQDGADNVQQALDIGAADYIMKPYNEENLIRRIQNAIVTYEFKRMKKEKQQNRISATN